MRKLLLAIAFVLMSVPFLVNKFASAADLEFKFQGFVISLTEKPCSIPQVLDLAAAQHKSKLKQATVVFPTGDKREACYLIQDGYVFLLDEALDGPDPILLDKFKAKEV